MPLSPPPSPKPDAAPLHHLLIVDDEPAVRLVMRRYLGRHGWHVAEAGNAEQAMSVLGDAQNRIEAVIVDMHLPGLSGTALCGRIAIAHPALSTRMIVASGDALAATAALEQEQLSCRVLAKPFELGELNRALSAVLES